MHDHDAGNALQKLQRSQVMRRVPEVIKNTLVQLWASEKFHRTYYLASDHASGLLLVVSYENAFVITLKIRKRLRDVISHP
jgi:hypothetical protein